MLIALKVDTTAAATLVLWVINWNLQLQSDLFIITQLASGDTGTEKPTVACGSLYRTVD